MIENKIKSLVNNLLNNEYTIGVRDDEGTIEAATNNPLTVVDAIMSVDECYLMAYKDGRKAAMIFIVLGNGEEDVFCDWSQSLDSFVLDAQRVR